MPLGRSLGLHSPSARRPRANAVVGAVAGLGLIAGVLSAAAPAASARPLDAPSLLPAPLSAPSSPQTSDGPAAVTIDDLRVESRGDEPLGVDSTTPTFTWRLLGSGPDAVQTAYQVQAVSDAGVELWDSRKVTSGGQRALYDGAALTSGLGVSWKVRVWDGQGAASDWSEPSRFEMGLLEKSDWDGAQWIETEQPPLNRGVTIEIGEQDAQYIRIDVTKLGLPIVESSRPEPVSRVALSEVQILAPDGTNYALDRTPSVKDQFACEGCGPRRLVDDRLTSPGYMSRHEFTQTPSSSKWLEFNLGSVKTVDRVVLFPRTDARLPDGQIPHFPVDFTIRAGTSSNPANVAATRVDEPNPEGPVLSNPLPIFAKPFEAAKPVSRARLYLAGLGAYEATVNGEDVTDTVLNPAVTNPLQSVQYGTYDVTELVRSGDNTIGVALGNGMTYVYPQANAVAGRNNVYTKFNSRPIPSGALAEAVDAGDTSVRLTSVAGYAVGDTVNVDTGDGGTRIESRRVTAIDGNVLSVDTAFGAGHDAGAIVLGSGSPQMPQMSITPRLIARVELTYADGTTSVTTSDPSWRVKDGPTITDNFYSGTDYDAREVQDGWDEPGADLGDAQGWQDSLITTAPSLETDLVWGKAQPIRVQKEFKASRIRKVADGDFSFDLGQNMAGLPQLNLKPGQVPAGTVIKMVPGETASSTGQVSTATSGSPNGILNTYTTSGDPEGESFTPQFMYHGFQHVQVSGLPADFVADEDTLVGLQTNADVPSGGSVTTSDEIVNKVHTMSEYSVRSNMQSIFTDCPHREKLGWLADMIQSMGAITTNFDVSAFLRQTQRSMAESQQDTGLIPATAPEFPIFGGGYRDDVNWGGAFILTPYELWTVYGDTVTMAEYYDEMKVYLEYVRAQTVDGLLPSGLKDWIAADTSTPAEATGTFGLYVIADAFAEMAAELGHDADAKEYAGLADELGAAYNARFYNPALKAYTTAGPGGDTGSQTLDALPLYMGIVPEADEQAVLDDLIERIRDYSPNGGGPHMSGGTVGLQPTYRVLMEHGRGDVLWDVLQEPTAPSYRNFIEAGRTTIPEAWNMAGSQNHMILLQIDEWINTGLTGISQAEGSIGFKDVVIKPQIVGDLTHVKGDRQTPYGEVASEWTKNDDGTLELAVSIPANSTGEIWVPTLGKNAGTADGATFLRMDTSGADEYAVYSVAPGDYVFEGGTSTLTSLEAPRITGTPTVGENLRADAGTWNPTPETTAYQWLRDGEPIEGATDDRLELGADDDRSTIAVEVTVTAQGLDETSATSAGVRVSPKTLKPTTLPAISGTPRVGEVLTASPGTWPAGTARSVRWQRDGRSIAGATTTRYRLSANDAGKRITVVVSGRLAGHTSGRAESRAVRVAAGRFTVRSRPTISGTAVVGGRVQANPPAFAPRQARTSYRWMRDGRMIKGATARVYRVQPGDAGKRLSVLVVAHRAGYADRKVTSASTRVARR